MEANEEAEMEANEEAEKEAVMETITKSRQNWQKVGVFQVLPQVSQKMS